ncbi:MAG: hypothetical protein QOH49_72 [Acidobacteriota bacterium]|jgi:hypothetical protein|nr:hypothetical protein [Acidobacteriota bacterium]
MYETFRLIERVTHVAPLGLRFWDIVAGRYLSAGLSVSAFPAHQPARRVAAVVNRSGVFVVHSAPGLREFESGEGEFRQSPPNIVPFVVEVEDRERRYIPFALDVELPSRGVYRWPHPPGRERLAPETAVPLYPSAVHDVPQGMAVLRTELRSTSDDGPGAWAVLEARFNGRLLGRGVADEWGRVTLIMPYPEPLDYTSGGGSPPELFAAGLPLLQQEWRLQLRASYTPGAAASPPAPPRPKPNLSDILSQQPTALWAGVARAEQLTEVRLRYGRELVIRSSDTASGPPPAPTLLPELYISTAKLTPS